MRNAYKKFFKSFFDVAAAGLMLIALMPVLLVIIILQFFFYGPKSIFFSQKRTGLKGMEFTLYKFQTMNNKRDCNGEMLADNDRITKIGSFLRKTSLDELPQLLNVIKGDMSFIGPRPLLPAYMPLYNDRQNRRHEVKPGITGWAQVNGRNSISWEEKFELDVWYVDRVSLKTDVKILYLSFVKVLGREGINSSETQTMEPFKGSNS